MPLPDEERNQQFEEDVEKDKNMSELAREILGKYLRNKP